MDIRITPAALAGKVAAVPSKSAAHRALIAAALADKPCTVRLGGSSNEDIDATIHCLRALGAGFEITGDDIRVTPLWRRLPEAATLDCGESGSTLRFLLPVAAALGVRATFTGRGRLPARPLSPLWEEMAAHGCRFEGIGGMPFTLTGRLTAGVYTLPGNVSSQYITGLLLALPLLESPSEIRLTTPLESAGYIDLTCGALAQFGLPVGRTPAAFTIEGGKGYRAPAQVAVEGDWSGAAFWLVAGALGAGVTCTGLDPASGQGDRAAADILGQMGATVQSLGDGVAVSGGRLRAVTIDAGPIPDLIPVLAAAAALAEGTTHIINAARLRIKESDRLAAVADGLTRLGADVTQLPDGLIINGKPSLAGGQVQGYNDHRIVMAMAIAAIGCQQPVTITGAEAVAKSYPRFFEDYQHLGGAANVL